MIDRQEAEAWALAVVAAESAGSDEAVSIPSDVVLAIEVELLDRADDPNPEIRGFFTGITLGVAATLLIVGALLAMSGGL